MSTGNVAGQTRTCMPEFIDPEFHCVGVSTTDHSDGIFHGHIPGGTTILWRNSLDKNIKCIDMGQNRGHAIEVSLNNKQFVLINVYLPYQSVENETVYMDALGAINAF